VDSFDGRLAVVTGGGSGMGRELVVQLAAEGCSVATCDVHEDTVTETRERAEKEAGAGVRITTHLCDVSDEAAVNRFRDEVIAEHETDHVDLLFNNAGIGGGASFVTGDRAEWERTFGVCWGGVYNCARAFVPLLVASDDAYLVNTSSVNGFWACLGPGIPHTAYSTAKFAVKGFSEALVTDFRVHAPHVKVAVVMPGHIGTDIVSNTWRVHGGGATPESMTTDQLAETRAAMVRQGIPLEGVTDEQLRAGMKMMGDGFRDRAPLSAAGAATVILDGVRADSWRILVGDDADKLDAAVRDRPLSAYDGGIGLGTIRLGD
jgi:NAD(P)-dependent dehydrogenase (short-subunit alcohol dehydrogenase family)